jgi:opacity protein-like surface antigen
MRKLAIAVLFPLFAVAAMAQTEVGPTPKAEAYANYSFARLGAANGLDNANLNWGWDTAVAGNVNSWMGLMADFAGHYGKQPILGTGVDAGTNIHSFLFGPRFAYRHYEKATPFFQTLFGVARVHQDAGEFLLNAGPGGVTVPGALPRGGSDIATLDTTDWPFAMKVGGGVDVKLTDKVYFRPFEVNYLMTRPHATNVNNLELSTGLAFRFGAR